jgi:hypothetical protein
MEDEVFQVDEFAVDPQRGAGIGELGSFEEACADGRTRDALVQSREGETSVESRPHQYLEQIRWHKGFLFPVIHDSLLA